MQTRKLGSYELLDKIGQGGMGEVWRARHDSLGSPAAVKLVRPEALGAHDDAGRERLLKRFRREAQTTARLSSPHTIRLFDFGTAPDGTLFYAMELLQGLDLATLVERFGPLPPARALRFLDQLCDSLAEAHQQGMIHRDIKPANIFACRLGLRCDFVKVLDFGLVKPLARGKDASQLTADQITAGTPAFMAPELAVSSSGEVGVRTDLYAVGCAAYWMLTGKLVFEGETAIETLLGHLQTPPTAPSLRAPGPIPTELDALVLACLAKRPEDRPPSALALRAALAAVAVDQAWSDDDACAWWAEKLPDLGIERAPLPPHESSEQAMALTQDLRAGAATPETAEALPKAPGAAAPAPAALPSIAPAPVALAEATAPARKPVFDPALSQERERAVAQLRNHFAYSVISLDEFERRVELAESAEAQTELAKVLADLPAIDNQGRIQPRPSAALVPARPAAPPAPFQPAAPPVPAGQGQALPASSLSYPPSKNLIAVLSGVERRGYWEVPAQLNLYAVLGGIDLDLSQARFTSEVIHISASCFMGGAKIVIPAGMIVENGIIGVLGGVELPKHMPPPNPSLPRLRLTGFALLGGVSVAIAKPRPALT